MYDNDEVVNWEYDIEWICPKCGVKNVSDAEDADCNYQYCYDCQTDIYVTVDIDYDELTAVVIDVKVVDLKEE